MRKFIAAAAMILASTTANADTIFEKVYMVPGASASAIEQAFGEKRMTPVTGTLEKVSAVFSFMGNGGNHYSPSHVSKYNITCIWLGVAQKLQADISLLTKDGKYKLVISNAVDVMGFEFNSASDSFIKKCNQDINDWAEMKHQKVLKVVDF